ncbi:MAG: porin family protein [FCB group bacterium]|nr:porin family protein [FCB group bacterium]
MKKIIGVMAILIILSAPVSAQSGMGINLYGGSGLTFPASDMGDMAKTGYHGSVGFGLQLVPTLETVGRVSYHSLPLKDETGSSGDFTITEYGIDVHANMADPTVKFKPYALIGAGYAKYEFSSDIIDGFLDGLKPKTKFFYAFGGGLKVNAAPKLKFFLEMRYTKISIKDASFNHFPITVGLNLSL